MTENTGKYARVSSLEQTSKIPDLGRPYLEVGDIVRIEAVDELFPECYVVFREKERTGWKRWFWWFYGKKDWLYQAIHPEDLIILILIMVSRRTPS